MYTAEELVCATQLAYCDFDKYEDKEKTVADILNLKENKYEIYYSYSKEKEDEATGDDATMIQSTKDFIDAIAAGEKCMGWKIVDVKNDESDSGLYAVVIETGEDEAIIAFRGSESYLHGTLSAEQVCKDWIQADLQILYGGLTAQEQAACQYMNEIADSPAFDKYQKIALTGHSLGGNLALVSTIYTATEEGKKNTDLASRIVQSVSMDGPGHPQEFIDKYQDAINEMQGVMTHYHWSLVGSILKSVCREKSEKYETRTSAEIYLAADILGEDRQLYGMAKAS
ncbi:MAG: DUF2974 domain-containing protein [Lachnospiraceae bacterium]|nr:DUF2974 domain-containing protein [Lachnospiraceae bacterium]